MKSVSLLLSICAILLISCDNTEKEIVIKNTANPNYNIGTWVEKYENEQIVHINDVYSLWHDDYGKIKQDSLIPAKLKAFTVSKDSIVLSEFLERSYSDNVPHIKVFNKKIDLNPYLRGFSCEYIRFLTPYSYNDLVFYTLNIIGKDEQNNKYYTQPLTLMINLNTKDCNVVGRGHYIDGSNDDNIAIFNDKYFGILDFYMNSWTYICKYYDLEGNYVGWSPNVGLEYTQTGEKVIYTSPLEIKNTDWSFTYDGNDKYGRPVSMKNWSTKEKYEIEYTKTGCIITGYDKNGKKQYEFEPNDENSFIDLRTWDMKFKYRGKLKEYKYSYDGTLNAIFYYNEKQSHYLRETYLSSNGTFICDGIYKNSNKLHIDDIVVSLSREFYTGKYYIYRIDPETGMNKEIAFIPQKKVKKYLLNYLYDLK